MRTPTIIAHIGFHKTGTSAVQEFCMENRDPLLGKGVYYPATVGGLPGHQELAWVLMSAQPDWADRHYDLDEVLRHYAAQLAVAGGRTLLLSAEDLCCESEVVAPRLRDAFPGALVKIIAYVRDPFDFMLSRFLHEVLYAERRPFIAFVRDELGTADFAWRLRAWSQVFGERNVTVRPYAAGRSDESGICADFLASIGASGVAPSAGQRAVNHGAPAASGDLFAYLNATPLADDVRRQIKDRMLATLAASAMPPLPKLRDFHLSQLAGPEHDFLEHCRDSLARQFGIRF